MAFLEKEVGSCHDSLAKVMAKLDESEYGQLYARLYLLYFFVLVAEKMVRQDGEFAVTTTDKENNSRSVVTQTPQRFLNEVATKSG